MVLGQQYFVSRLFEFSSTRVVSFNGYTAQLFIVSPERACLVVTDPKRALRGLLSPAASVGKDRFRIQRIVYRISALSGRGDPHENDFIHDFKRPVFLEDGDLFAASGRLFRSHPLDDLLGSKSLAGASGIQFIA